MDCAISIAAGAFHSGFINNEKLYTFGHGKLGRLGRGESSDVDFNPQEVKGHLKFKFASLGYYHSCGITKDDMVYVWGGGAHGRLGLNSINDQYSPTPLLSLSPSASTTIISIACGAFHTIALSKQGNLFSWGLGLNGRLGHNDERDVLSPRIISSLVASNVKAAAVEVGDKHSLFIDSGGGVYTWGCGLNGRLGHGEEKDYLSPTIIQYLKDKRETITCISGGMNNSGCVTSEGKLYMWGSNENGKLGSSAPSYSLFPIIVSILKDEEHDEGIAKGLKRDLKRTDVKIVNLSLGAFHSLIMDINGKLYGFGSNKDGALSLPYNNDVISPSLIPSYKVKQIKAGGRHSVILSIDNNVYCCGKDIGNNFVEKEIVNSKKEKHLEEERRRRDMEKEKMREIEKEKEMEANILRNQEKKQNENRNDRIMKTQRIKEVKEMMIRDYNDKNLSSLHASIPFFLIPSYLFLLSLSPSSSSTSSILSCKFAFTYLERKRNEVVAVLDACKRRIEEIDRCNEKILKSYSLFFKGSLVFDTKQVSEIAINKVRDDYEALRETLWKEELKAHAVKGNETKVLLFEIRKLLNAVEDCLLFYDDDVEDTLNDIMSKVDGEGKDFEDGKEDEMMIKLHTDRTSNSIITSLADEWEKDQMALMHKPSQNIIFPPSILLQIKNSSQDVLNELQGYQDLVKEERIKRKEKIDLTEKLHLAFSSVIQKYTTLSSLYSMKRKVKKQVITIQAKLDILFLETLNENTGEQMKKKEKRISELKIELEEMTNEEENIKKEVEMEMNSISISLLSLASSSYNNGSNANNNGNNNITNIADNNNRNINIRNKSNPNAETEYGSKLVSSPIKKEITFDFEGMKPEDKKKNVGGEKLSVDTEAVERAVNKKYIAPSPVVTFNTSSNSLSSPINDIPLPPASTPPSSSSFFSFVSNNRNKRYISDEDFEDSDVSIKLLPGFKGKMGNELTSKPKENGGINVKKEEGKGNLSSPTISPSPPRLSSLLKDITKGVVLKKSKEKDNNGNTNNNANNSNKSNLASALRSAISQRRNVLAESAEMDVSLSNTWK